MHRTTVPLFEPAVMPPCPPFRLQPAGTIRLFVTALVGVGLFAFSMPALFSQDGSPKPSASTKRPKRGAPPATKTESGDDDSQGVGDQPQSVFTISKPLTTDEAWKTWEGRGRGEYNARVHAGDLDRESLQIINNGIRAQIFAMSLPTQRDNLGTIVATLIRSVHGAADAKTDPGTQRSVRQAMIKEIIADCRKLGDNQFYVRLNAAILLANLFIVAENQANRVQPEFYSEAFEPLMEVLERPGQPDAIKVAAVNGLRNASLFGNPPLEPSRKIRLATKLRDELEKTDAGEWYQQRICETLGSLDQIFDLDGRPFIVHALAKVLYDRNRSLCARSAAAKALGRAQLPPTIDLNVVAYGIADLSRQIVEARNEKKKHVRRWCIDDLYLAFQPINNVEKARRAGLMERVDEPTYQKYKESIKEVYALVLPMVVQEYKEADSAFPPEVGDHINEWLKTHTPAQLRIAPGLPLITTTQLTKTDSAR